MQALREDPDLAKGLSTIRSGERRHLCLRVEAAGRDTGSRLIVWMYSEITFAVPRKECSDRGSVVPTVDGHGGERAGRGSERACQSADTTPLIWFRDAGVQRILAGNLLLKSQIAAMAAR